MFSTLAFLYAKTKIESNVTQCGDEFAVIARIPNLYACEKSRGLVFFSLNRNKTCRSLS